MEIKKIRNFIGKCACVGCTERPTVHLTLELRDKDNMIRKKKSFFVCIEHAGDIAVELTKNK